MRGHKQFQMFANGECRKTASCGVFVDSLLLIVCQEVATKVCYCCYKVRSFNKHTVNQMIRTSKFKNSMVVMNKVATVLMKKCPRFSQIRLGGDKKVPSGNTGKYKVSHSDGDNHVHYKDPNSRLSTKSQ